MTVIGFKQRRCLALQHAINKNFRRVGAQRVDIPSCCQINRRAGAEPQTGIVHCDGEHHPDRKLASALKGSVNGQIFICRGCVDGRGNPDRGGHPNGSTGTLFGILKEHGRRKPLNQRLRLLSQRS